MVIGCRKVRMEEMSLFIGVEEMSLVVGVR